jgi:Tfp pilus assembly protein FimT
VTGRRLLRNPRGQGGLTLLEVAIVVPLLAIVLALTVVSVTKFQAQRTLLGWSDVMVSDIRGAQQSGIARRASVTVTFAAKSGVNAASYAVAVGGTTVRSQKLPTELNLTSTSVSFSTLGIPTSSSAITVTMTDSIIGRSRTITINAVTGSVTAQ